MNFDSILFQIFQPYFYYSIIFLVVSFVCIKVLTRYCSFIGQKTKSLLRLFPLTVPLIVMLILTLSTQRIQVLSSSQSTTQVTLAIGSIFSTTNLLCIIGLAAAALFTFLMIAADDRLARRVLGVIPLAPEEYAWLQTEISELSKKLSIAAPKIGLVEEFQPNAFTIGYGKNATVVFSFGLLNMLDKKEVTAVVAHELMHVKNRDFFYKTLASALTIVSFYNPLAWVVSSGGQREREMLADKGAVQLLGKPEILGSALTKISKAIKKLPKESMLVSFQSNLLVSSSIIHRVRILSTHPQMKKRLWNILEPHPYGKMTRRNTCSVILLSLLLICSIIIAGFAAVNLQNEFHLQTRAYPSSQNNLPLTASTSFGLEGGNSSALGSMAHSDRNLNYHNATALNIPIISMPT